MTRQGPPDVPARDLPDKSVRARSLPGAVLFACTMNSVRSPMAAAILRHLAGRRAYVESAGVRAAVTDTIMRDAASRRALAQATLNAVLG